MSRRSELQSQWDAMCLDCSQQRQRATQAVLIQQQLGQRCTTKIAQTPANDGHTGGQAAMLVESLLYDDIAR